MREITRDWIYGVVEDAMTDVMGVMEMFEVTQDEAEKVLEESHDWLRGDPIQVTL